MYSFFELYKLINSLKDQISFLFNIIFSCILVILIYLYYVF